MAILRTQAIDPEGFVRALRSPGAAAYPLLDESYCARLAETARALPYEPQPEAVGPPGRRVRQRLASRQLAGAAGPFEALVRALAALVADVHARLPASPWRAPPRFDDFLVQRYPPGPFALTPHLDGKRFVDLVAVAVLAGEARFCVCANRVGDGLVDVPAPPGNVIFLRAPGFDGAEDGRPFHCVLDVRSERYTLGLRHDSRNRL